MYSARPGETRVIPSLHGWRIVRWDSTDSSGRHQYIYDIWWKLQPEEAREAQQPPIRGVKYVDPVPRSVQHALALDREAGNTFWADAIRKEVASLLALNCFEFHGPDYKPSSDYQWTKLSMIFKVKQDGR